MMSAINVVSQSGILMLKYMPILFPQYFYLKAKFGKERVRANKVIVN